MLRYAASETCTCWNRAGVVSFSGRKVMYIGVAHLRWKKVLLLVGWLTVLVRICSVDLRCLPCRVFADQLRHVLWARGVECLPCALLG
jgi:hypothetical protein